MRTFEDILDDEDNIRDCPECDGWAIPYKLIENTLHYICLDCGSYFSVELEKEL